MSSPIPPDPYQALGVPKDADISVIRSAHRKLVLRLHPDRIKDEAEKLRGKDEFHKVQQAYELLSDPDRRSRYDDRITLAALRKEAMTRDSPMRTPSATYPMRPAPPTSSHSIRRDFRPDGNVYEERAPDDYFASRESFSSRDRYDEEPSRASARKYDGPSERRSSAKTSESGKSKKSGWDNGVSGMSVKMAMGLKKKATQAKDRVEEKKSKDREREKSATKAKVRDQEQRRDRSERLRRTIVEDASSSDSDTATQVTDATIRGSSFETGRSFQKAKRSSERTQRDDEDEYDDAWERRHQGAAEYMAASAGPRPTMGRSDSHSYWQREERARRSGSDSDRRPTSSKGRRPDVDSAKVRPPPMQTHNSSPANLHHLEERLPRELREPQRSASGSSAVPERDQRRDAPSFKRSQTMPSSRSTKKDTVPAKGSNLKHAETHDSGYGSSSSPHTPELGGTSPTRESRETRRELPRQTSSKYKIVDEEEDYGRPIGRTPTVILDEEDRHRRYQSPERRSERPERPRLSTGDRTTSSRVSSSKAESSSTRPRELR